MSTWALDPLGPMNVKTDKPFQKSMAIDVIEPMDGRILFACRCKGYNTCKILPPSALHMTSSHKGKSISMNNCIS